MELQVGFTKIDADYFTRQILWYLYEHIKEVGKVVRESGLESLKMDDRNSVLVVIVKLMNI